MPFKSVLSEVASNTVPPAVVSVEVSFDLPQL